MEFLKRCKNEMLELQACAVCDVMNHRRAYKGVVAASAGFWATLFSISPLLAAEDVNVSEFFTNISNIVLEIYKGAIGLVTVIAALLLVVAFIVRMNGNPQRATQATQWITRIIISYVCINIIGLVFKVINSTTKDYTYDAMFGAGG